MSQEVVVALVGAIALVLGGLATLAGTRGKTRADSRASLDARIDGRLTKEIERLDARIDEQDQKLEDQEQEIDALRTQATNAERVKHAALRIIKSFVAQWPAAPYPRFNTYDIAELEEDTIPTAWLTPKETS
ncbi:hypothetical protein [Microbacterium telephonicum]|uniref:Uncharacterized protein n=1 Tax=Microbacterium telephonicum TaxID=1714841 RepID=A0A498C457_9MICO|nr:hypothetical protein [Microbacterium telephonicum]RLK47608.1 hypothetical protein C7474_2200 [Microbacterium telephonicum]